MASINKKIIILILILLFASILRLAWVDTIPVSLYSDEISQGYNAYSILKTGRDEHGSLLPVSVRSFGDWKPPLPTYLMIPAIKLFGLNEFAVRLPSVLFGLGSIALMYLLVTELLRIKGSGKIALLSAFMMTISPWHILQSRSAMLVIVSLFFLQLGILAFLKARIKSSFLVLSAVSFVAAIYSYYGARVVVPLTVLALVVLYKKVALTNKKEVLIGCLMGIILLLPLLIGFLKNQDILVGRAKTVSIFYDQGVKLKQWELFSQDGITADPRLTLFFHNDTYLYTRDILQRFLSHFDADFLFFTGDGAYPFKIPNMGILYILDGIMIVLGLGFAFRNKLDGRYLLILIALISIIPAALTYATPSSNRTFHIIFPLCIFIGIGLYQLARQKNIFTKIAIPIITILYVVSIWYFMTQYFVILPKNYAQIWNYGWKEVFSRLKRYEPNTQYIYVSDKNGMPYIYYAFYNKYDPEKFQKNIIKTFTPDEFGYEHVEGIDNYIFIRDFDWKQLKENMLPNSMYVVPWQDVDKNDKYLEKITYPDKTDAFAIMKNP